MKRVLTILCLIALTCPYLKAADEQPPQRTITVVGEASVKVVPDKVVLTCGVQSWDVNLQNAKQKNSDTIAKAFAACESLDIAKENIQTDYLSISPEYEDGWRGRKFLGYYVRNTFSVTLTDTKKIEELITKLLEAGVNQVDDISFQITDLQKYREQAREMALKAAKDKAIKMANVLDQKLGQPLEVTENPTYDGGYWQSANRMAQAQTSIGGGSDSVGETVALGKISIRANVQIKFALES